MNQIIAPSLLSANFGNLQQDIQMINQSKADWFHIDIMDGHFVPNLSMGFPILKTIVKHAQKPLDVHLMISNPDNYIERFCKEGQADYLTVHIEACTHLHRTLQYIKSFDVKAGIALNPHTPISLLEDIVEEADLILLMSVNPGFGGQKFIPHTYEKIRKLRQIIDNKHLSTLIEVDGGIGLNNYKEVISAGSNALVCGNSVFSSDNPLQTIEELKK